VRRIKEISTELDQYPESLQTREAQAARSHLRNLRRDLSHALPDAPYKDPRDYAKLELRKQLLSAAESDDDYLALVRGDDQVERYKEGMDKESARGMRHIYDKVYVSEMKKLAKQYGADFEEVELATSQRKDIRPGAWADYEIEGAEELAHWGEQNINRVGFYGDIDDAPELAFYGLSHFYNSILEQPDVPPPVIKKIEEEFQDAWSRTNSMRSLIEKNRDKEISPHDRERIAQDWNQITHSIDLLERLAVTLQGEDYLTKTFPAIKLTPEVRERIKKAGAPVMGVIGATILTDEETPQYAEGGTVSTLDQLKEAVMSTTGSAIEAMAPMGQNIIKSVDSLVTQGRLPDEVTEGLARNQELIRLGLMSQWYGIDPDTRKAEFALSPSNLGKVRPGIVDEFVSLPAFGGFVGLEVPEFAENAVQRLIELGEQLENQTGIKPAQGFGENMAESTGVMLGQVPVPGSVVNRLKALRAGKGAKPLRPYEAEYLEGDLYSPEVQGLLELTRKKPSPLIEGAKKLSTSYIEWFAPTVDPKISNYLAGGAFGGLMGSLFEEDPKGAQEFVDLVNKADTTDPEVQDDIQFLADHMAQRLGISPGEGYAKGGKVNAARRAFLKKAGTLAAGTAVGSIGAGKAIMRKGKKALPHSSIIRSSMGDLDKFLLKSGSDVADVVDSDDGISYYLSELAPKVREMMAENGFKFDLDTGDFEVDLDRIEDIDYELNRISEAYEGDLEEAIKAGEIEDPWEVYDLGGDDDVDYNVGYPSTFFEALEEYVQHLKNPKASVAQKTETPSLEREPSPSSSSLKLTQIDQAKIDEGLRLKQEFGRMARKKSPDQWSEEDHLIQQRLSDYIRKLHEDYSSEEAEEVMKLLYPPLRISK
jgi:hypothetical protein